MSMIPSAAARALAVLALLGLGLGVAQPGADAAPGQSELQPVAPVAPSGDGVAFAGRFYFKGTTSAGGAELWSTDGTAAGTRLVRDVNPGAASGLPEHLVVFGGRLYFTADDGSHGFEWWSTDGTAEGTRLLEDLNPGAAGAALGEPVLLDGRLYFYAKDPVHGLELFSTDGTTITIAADVVPGPGSSNPAWLMPLGDRLVFRAALTGGRRKVWEYTPGAPAAERLDTTPDGADLEPQNLHVLGAHVVFEATDPADGPELWVTGGEPGDARPVHSATGDAVFDPGPVVVLNGHAYFNAAGPEVGQELWTTDGTDAGTAEVVDLNPGDAASDPRYPVLVGDQVLFTANDGTHGRELWASGGSAATTRMLTDLRGPADGADNLGNRPTEVAGRLLFPADDGSGLEPWVTDGTPAGTRRLADLAPGAAGSAPETVGVLGNTMFFAADPGGGAQLYAWTATASTTTMSAKKHYSARLARRKKVDLRVTVTTALGTPATGGTVTLVLHGRTVGTAPLLNGIAKVRITKRLKPGRKHAKKYAITATWSGSVDATASTSGPVKVRIGPKRKRHHR